MQVPTDSAGAGSPPDGNPSPASSASATPTNNSPSSPRLMNAQLQQIQSQSRQLRPPKSPLYVPAALRRTERAPKPSPLTPPRSVHGSVDGLDTTTAPTEPLSRRSTVDSTRSGVSRLAQDEWLRDQNLGEVTGSPTREHWKADSASPSCDSPVCKSFFGIFVRRHHCRHCGHVFCSSHTPYTIPLDQNARFHPDGIPSRSCDLCWAAYRRWEQARTDKLNQIQHNLLANLDAPERSRGWAIEADRLSVGDAGSPSIEHQDGMIASSVPRDWSWSTF
ncbi:Zn finger protein [Microsporum canis]|uniref:FYVE-type domain-containing protein n=1 Tax=Arthroderma otae (strain ATCC MYA-4605 / CBS 113480) TaxID=554155 RepID=C5G1C8_ARTOC|nr:conserved hypothetical protein [Microsporum canis CBS 113480]EEQ28591.1 conserved hypothetical protein [Microsporum canis CBS 113480]